MTERHLGLMPCAEIDDARTRVQLIGARVGAQVDLQRVRALAASAPALAAASAPDPAPLRRASVRIGIARDRAFGFYYPDDLAALEAAGAELVFIDTLHDSRLPPLDGLFIGGGFPETSMHAIEANAGMRHALGHAIRSGLPAYAECGGLMLLSRSLTWRGRTAAMVGAIAADAVMHARPVGRGYVQLRETAAMPWLPTGALVQGHEFHHSTLTAMDPGLRFAYDVQRGHGIDGRRDGIVVHNLLASYTHLRSAAGTAWATRFVDFVRRKQVAANSPALALAT
jgi:cobyrinic acid a,c-diamide synthase